MKNSNIKILNWLILVIISFTSIMSINSLADNSDALYINNKSKSKLIVIICSQSYYQNSPNTDKVIKDDKYGNGSMVMEVGEKLKVLDVESLKFMSNSSNQTELDMLDYDVSVFPFLDDYEKNGYYNCDSINPIKTYSKPTINQTLYFDCDCQNPVKPEIKFSIAKVPTNSPNSNYLAKSILRYDLRDTNKGICLNQKIYFGVGSINVTDFGKIEYSFVDIDKIYMNGESCNLVNPKTLNIINGINYKLQQPNFVSPEIKILPFNSPEFTSKILIKHLQSSKFCFNGLLIDKSKEADYENRKQTYLSVKIGDIITDLNCDPLKTNYKVTAIPVKEFIDLEYKQFDATVTIESGNGFISPDTHLVVNRSGIYNSIKTFLCINNILKSDITYSNKFTLDSNNYNLSIVEDSNKCSSAPNLYSLTIPESNTVELSVSGSYDFGNSNCKFKEFDSTKEIKPLLVTESSSDILFKNNSKIDVIAVLCDYPKMFGIRSNPVVFPNDQITLINRKNTLDGSNNEFLPYDNDGILSFQSYSDTGKYILKSTLNIYPKVNIAGLKSINAENYCKKNIPIKKFENIKWGETIQFNCDCENSQLETIPYKSKLSLIKNSEDFYVSSYTYKLCIDNTVKTFFSSNYNTTTKPKLEFSSVDYSLNLNNGDTCVYAKDKTIIDTVGGQNYKIYNQETQLIFDKPINYTTINNGKVIQRFKSQSIYPQSICVNDKKISISNLIKSTDPFGNDYYEFKLELNPGDKVSADILGYALNNTLGCSTDYVTIPQITEPQYDLNIVNVNLDKFKVFQYNSQSNSETGISIEGNYTYPSQILYSYKELCVNGILTNILPSPNNSFNLVELVPGKYKINLVGVGGDCNDLEQQKIEVIVKEGETTKVQTDLEYTIPQFNCIAKTIKPIDPTTTNPTTTIPPLNNPPNIMPQVINTPTIEHVLISKLVTDSSKKINFETVRSGGVLSNYSITCWLCILALFVFSKNYKKNTH